jgi:hypothetical protein
LICKQSKAKGQKQRGLSKQQSRYRQERLRTEDM